MKKLMIITTLVILSSCNRETGLEWFSTRKAGEYFDIVKKICDSDNGILWGENLHGPLMFIDNKNRVIYSNVPDSEGLLKPRDGIYTGELPKERLITNNVIEFGGVKFGMVPLPETEDSYRIAARSVHSLFHLYQESQGLKPSTFNPRHMNDRNARLFLKLEWKALTGAIESSGEERNQAIRDALVFRGARRELFPNAIADENKFENYEGLTTFTYMKLCTSDREEFKSKLLEYLGRIYNNTSYALGYGFVHGALYATLLDDKSFDFKQIQTSDFDLGEAVSAAYGVVLPELCRDVAGSLAMNYDLPAIRIEESEREAMINERTRKIVTTYFERPVMVITMESPNFSFEPEDINFLDTLGTLYESLRVSDNWGKLTVDDVGALITNDLRTLRISAKEMRIERNHITGEGWHVILNDGWHAEDGKNGSYAVRKQML
ncbi:MAG: hypothetical protein MUC30_05005 [Bacteroidales bacterium]|nr:hypothetical protein [Bacteroidales bacterium]